MKLEAAYNAFSPCTDRFVTDGYREGYDFEKTCEAVQNLGNIPALPIIFDGTQDPYKIKKTLENYGLRAGTVCPDNYCTARWKDGSLANRSAAVRNEIVKLSQYSLDFCKEVGGIDVMLWLAHDGYDYCFEDNYRIRWGFISDSLYKIASHRPDVNVTLEYKRFEPRAYQYIGDISKALLMCEEVGLQNLGVVIDYGHALIGGENPAESVALAAKYNRLFHIHLNDNYRRFDDDMIIGSVSFWETLEFFYQLDRVGYDGWYVIDVFTPRLDGHEVLKEFVERAEAFMRLAENLPYQTLETLQADNDVVAILRLLREYTLKT